MEAALADRATRIAAERDFHDRQAADRAAWFRHRPDDLVFADDAWLEHESWIRPALDSLGAVRGRRVLDLGCGHGMAAVVLARRGARVTALELSGGYLRESLARARANGVRIAAVQADGHRLPFADAAFDRIWGNAVLHHLDLAVAGPELRRVLAPGGCAVFCEPWRGNPLLEWARRRRNRAGRHHTADERPLGPAEVAVLRTFFPDLRLQGHQLLGLAARRLPHRFGHLLHRCDASLLRCMPRLTHLCRYVVLHCPA